MIDIPLITAIAALVTAVGGAALGVLRGRHEGAEIAQKSVQAAQEFWAATLERQNVEIDKLRDRVKELEQQDTNMDKLVALLESVFSWIERGARDPKPVRPDWLKPGAFSPLATQTTPQEES